MSQKNIAKPALLYYYYDTETNIEAVSDEHKNIMAQIEAEVLSGGSSGNEIGLITGGSIEGNRACINMQLYDIPAFMEKAPIFLTSIPHMLFCKEPPENGPEISVTDASVEDFVTRLEEKLGQDEEEGFTLVADAAAEIVSIIEAIPEEKRDYTINNIFSRCLNNSNQYQRALDVLDAISSQGASDPRWHYKRGYALYFMDGREDEAKAAFTKAKALADTGDSVLTWCDEMLEEIADWKKRQRKNNSLFQRLGRWFRGLFGKKDGKLQVTYYAEEEMNALEAFIQEQFGEYENVFHEIVSVDIHVDICIIPPSTERNYYTLVTMGMGAAGMNIPQELRGQKLGRAEVMLTLPPDWDIHNEDEKYYWPIRCLKTLAHLPIDNKTWLGWGHTISNQQPFAENTGLSSMILLMPGHFGQRAVKCQLPNEDEVIFYQVLPLYESEMTYKMENGAVALLNRFPNNFDMVIDVERQNYV